MRAGTPFRPHYGTNQVVTASATAASINLNPTDTTVRIVNVGANSVNIRISNAATTATTADMIIRGNSEVYITKGEGMNVLSYISASGSTMTVMTGEGGF